jgi:fluoroquinolone transport system permease protein
MRLLSAIRADLRFQFKQGFFTVYAVLTMVYLIILSFLPADWLPYALPLLVFTDPSILGLFFIGGILMLEKSQGILMAMVVSPLRTWEFILSKVLSLSLVSLLTALAISYFSGYGQVQWLLLIMTVVLTASFFTLYGIVINAGCETVNQYILKTIPWMLLLVFPCFSLIGFPGSELFLIVPSVAALKLMLGVYSDIAFWEAVPLIFLLVAANLLMLKYTIRVFEEKIVFGEG